MKNILAIVVISFLFASCANQPMKASSGKGYGFTGKFLCPKTKSQKTGDSFGPFVQTIEHKKVNGVNILVTHYEDTKLKPYHQMISVADGLWRYTTMYQNKKTQPIEVRVELLDENTLIYESKVPPFTSESGKKVSATHNKGQWKIDPETGHKHSSSSFLEKEIVCKRL